MTFDFKRFYTNYTKGKCKVYAITSLYNEVYAKSIGIAKCHAHSYGTMMESNNTTLISEYSNNVAQILLIIFMGYQNRNFFWFSWGLKTRIEVLF